MRHHHLQSRLGMRSCPSYRTPRLQLCDPQILDRKNARTYAKILVVTALRWGIFTSMNSGLRSSNVSFHTGDLRIQSHKSISRLINKNYKYFQSSFHETHSILFSREVTYPTHLGKKKHHPHSQRCWLVGNTGGYYLELPTKTVFHCFWFICCCSQPKVASHNFVEGQNTFVSKKHIKTWGRFCWTVPKTWEPPNGGVHRWGLWPKPSWRCRAICEHDGDLPYPTFWVYRIWPKADDLRASGWVEGVLRNVCLWEVLSPQNTDDPLVQLAIHGNCVREGVSIHYDHLSIFAFYLWLDSSSPNGAGCLTVDPCDIFLNTCWQQPQHKGTSTEL